MSRTIARPSTIPAQPPSACERAADDQRRQRPSQPAEHRAKEKQRKPGEQHRAPAEAIGDRAIDQLSDRDPGEEQCQHQLDRAGRCIEYRGEHRQRRHQHVQRRGRDRGDEGQQDERRSAPGNHRAGMCYRHGEERVVRTI